MTTIWLGLLAVGFQGDMPPAPVAMVLLAKGGAVIVHADKERPAAEMELLVPGDVVRVKTGGTVKVVVLADGHREEIAGAVEVKVSPEGCQPSDAVKREAGKLSPVQMATLRRMAQNQRGGVVVIRSGNVPQPHAVMRSPMYGTTVLSDRPTFRWGKVPDALSYRIELFYRPAGKPERSVWKVATRETSLEYPKEQSALMPGGAYRWEVIALLGGDREPVVVNGRFLAPSETTLEHLKEFNELAKSDDPADWLTAATTLEAMNLYESALPFFEKLAETTPGNGRYHEILSEYYQRSGDAEKATSAIEKAKDLKMIEKE